MSTRETYAESLGSSDAVRILTPAKPSSLSKLDPAAEEMMSLNLLARPAVLLSGPNEAVVAAGEKVLSKGAT